MSELDGWNLVEPKLPARHHPAVAGDDFSIRIDEELLPLIAMVYQLGDRGIVFRSLTEVIDCSTPSGRFNLHVHAAMAEFERSVLSERTRAGMTAARKRGRQLGRPRALDETKRLLARQLLDGGQAPGEIAQRLNVSFSTVRRATIAR